jgi:HlyD family secretion protein
VIQRWFKTLFAFGVCLGAAGMLYIAAQFIQKNTPKPVVTEALKLPPQQPRGALVADQDTQPAAETGGKQSYIGGVGIIEPQSEIIAIGSEVPGVVEKVLVRPGDVVVKGQVLLQLDQRQSKADVQVAQSELLAQQARLSELLAQIDIQQARVKAAEVSVQEATLSEANAAREYERAKQLRTQNAVSQEEMDTRTLSRDTSQVRTLEAKARLLEAEAGLRLLAEGDNPPSIAVQKAAVGLADANLLKAQTLMEIRTVKAPIDGTILSVVVRAGEFVPASIVSTPYLSMGVVDPLHVRVDIDETEIPRFRAGAKAYAALRGKPSEMVELEYVRTEPLVSPKRTLTGSVSERVDTRVMQIIYSVSPSKLKAAIGQQVDVYIEDLESSNL